MGPLQRSRAGRQNPPRGDDWAGENGEETCHLTSARKALQPGLAPRLLFGRVPWGPLPASDLPSRCDPAAHTAHRVPSYAVRRGRNPRRPPSGNGDRKLGHTELGEGGVENWLNI